jgi:hypothetical protein
VDLHVGNLLFSGVIAGFHSVRPAENVEKRRVCICHPMTEASHLDLIERGEFINLAFPPNQILGQFRRPSAPCFARRGRRCGTLGRCSSEWSQGCATRQSVVMMWGREFIGEKMEWWRKLERAFLAIIWPVASSRFLTGGLWAVNAIIPCNPVRNVHCMRNLRSPITTRVLRKPFSCIAGT